MFANAEVIRHKADVFCCPSASRHPAAHEPVLRPSATWELGVVTKPETVSKTWVGGR